MFMTFSTIVYTLNRTMGPVGITFSILLFLTITIFGCFYTFIWAVKLLTLVIYYIGELLWYLSASIVLIVSVIIILTVTYLALTEITKIWKPKRRVEAISSRIFQELHCVICKESESEVLYVPCMHLCTCQKCAKMMRSKKCPICREGIKEKYLRITEEIEDGIDMDSSFNIW